MYVCVNTVRTAAALYCIAVCKEPNITAHSTATANELRAKTVIHLAKAQTAEQASRGKCRLGGPAREAAFIWDILPLSTELCRADLRHNSFADKVYSIAEWCPVCSLQRGR